MLTVNGSGSGDTTSGTDQLHFTYQNNAGGNVEIIARMTSFTNASAHARAGIMVRTSNNASAVTTANEVLAYQDAADGNNNIVFTARDQASGTCSSDGVETRMQFPLWLRLDRIGENFAVYKSPDGVLWSALGNTSGWQLTPTGALEVGFFVSSDGVSSNATATFDNISIGTPNMGYSTSWVGNSFGGRIQDGHVANTIGAMWTAPNGTCYTNSYYDEGGTSSMIYQNGKIVSPFNNGNWLNSYFGNDQCGEGTITSDGSMMYLAANGWLNCYIAKTDMNADASSTQAMLFVTNLWDSAKSYNVTSGMAVVGNQLYVGDERDNEILVAQTSVPLYYTALNSSVDTTTTTINTSGVPNAAPASVYQSSRECDYLPYIIPGMNNGTTYTVRCHFCEYSETGTGERIIDVSAGSQSVQNYDVVAQAGGDFLPAVMTIPNVNTDGNGNIDLVFTYGTGSQSQPRGRLRV